MTGSGATCFGLFDDRAVAADAARQLTAQQETWWISTVTLG
jgi:4-diphosphocytidyl-2-C-methyl-D-erythritol kinase